MPRRNRGKGGEAEGGRKPTRGRTGLRRAASSADLRDTEGTRVPARERITREGACRESGQIGLDSAEHWAKKCRKSGVGWGPGLSSMNSELLAKLELSRKELLDLGLRNALVNHRLRAKQVRVVDERSTEIFRLLVSEGRNLTFEALAEERAQAAISEQADPAARVEELDWDTLLAQPDDEGAAPSDRHSDLKLQTSLTSEKLQARLLSIHNDARGYVEEQGVNILFLALGFLHWYEADAAGEARRAPLVLVPVELERANAQERFQISYTGDEIGDNLSLIEKLKTEFGVTLPLLGDIEELNLDVWFSEVEAAISKLPRWKVERNEVTLGFFSFGKFLMYRDLDPKGWRATDVPRLLTAVLSDGFRAATSLYGPDTHVDEVLSPADVRQVKDADSSQVLAILDAMSGRDLVLQGPPGTGKSQTITNLIAECVGAGKKVLFVAEKMAALEVVKRRLDETGLGDAVLELHSHKTNKKQVLEELRRTLQQGKPIAGRTDDDIATLTRLRDKLNAYCEAVNRPIGTSRHSFVAALGHAIRAAAGKEVAAPFDFEPMAKWTDADYRTKQMSVELMDRHLAEAGSPADSPFYGTQIDELLPSQRPAIEEELRQARALTKDLIAQGNALAASMALAAPEQRNEIDVLCRAAQRAMSAPHLSGVTLTSGEWQARRDELTQLLAAGHAVASAHMLYGATLIDDAWNQDLVPVRQAYVTKGSKWWRFLSAEFRRAKARMQGLARTPLPKNTREVLEIIDTILDSQKHQKRFDELAPLGKSLFGAQWKGLESDWEVLETLTDWIVALYRDVGDGKLPTGLIAFLSGAPSVDELRGRVQALEQLLTRHSDAAARVAKRFALPSNGAPAGEWGMSLAAQEATLSRWLENLDRLEQHVRYNVLASQLKGEGLDFIVARCAEWREERGALLRLFDYSWYNGLVERAYRETPEIRQFDRSQQEFMLEEFGRLDHLLFRHNQVRLALAHWQSLPNMSAGGETAVVMRELNKKKRILPIRSLMKEAGHAVQAIKPVIMMSPMSIATYVPPGSVEFDLVVFDEASQVKPVDGFGALLRGTQAVVVGDSKQLPPTSFFDSLLKGDDEADTEIENAGDMESILSLFLGKGAPERMLRWHYRSRHHSLIAVSNNEFYDNRLVVFPSPGVNPYARGLRLRHLPHTVYDRGKTSTNPEEAKAVAEAVMAHAREYPDLTLGVVAFSVAQRDAIEMQLERLRRLDASCESFFSTGQREPFFIKNLENVQGDERDVIYISIGYGRAEAGYMSMSFGPLNRDGGERRLNVLISRSRLAMDVFCNFTSADLDLARTNARAIVALKNFLAYAETGVLEAPIATGREPDSAFEQEVLRALASRGYQVEPQVGTAGFFIDIGVRHPQQAGAYLLGIECDGATYHSSRSARDRDRLRQEVLEGLGWRLHRIWSTDWYRNPKVELERAIAAIERARTTKLEGTRIASSPAKKQSPTGIVRTSQSCESLSAERPAYPGYTKMQPRIRCDGFELHEANPESLVDSVARIVGTESPVHRMEVMRRITEGAGLKRTGSRIQSTLQVAIDVASSKGRVRVRGDFLWDPGMKEPTVRDRSNLESSEKKLELVAPEEIRVALLAEIRRGFSMSVEAAMSSAARALGFQRVTAQAEDVFRAQIRYLVDDGTLKHAGDLVSATSGNR